MKLFGQIRDYLFNIGLSEGLSFQESLRRELLNRFIAIGFLMVFIHFVLSLIFIRLNSDFLITLNWFLLLFTSLILNIRGHHFTSRVFIIYAGSIVVFVLNIVFGPKLRLEPMYILFFVLSMMFFNLKQKLKAMAFIAILALVAMLICLFKDAPYAEYVSAHGAITRFVFVVSMIAILTGKLFKQSYEYNRLIQQQNHKLLEANNQLKSLNYIFAHDLKEPVRSIVSYSQLINKSVNKGQEVNTEHLSFITKSGLQLNTLLDDIKTLQLAQANNSINEVIDFKELVDDVKDQLKDLIKEKQASIIVEHDFIFKSSRLAWFLICKNLIENAIKYNSNSNPQCKVVAKKKETFIEVNVEDNGLGINPSYHEDVFILFKRLNADFSRGSGLGLNIVRSLIEKLGGQVKIISSEIGKGTCFQLIMPLTPDNPN